MSDQKSPQPKDTKVKKDAGQIFLEEVTAGPPRHLPRWRRVLQSILVPFLAIFTGLVLGGVVIVLTTTEVYTGFQASFGEGLKAAWHAVATAYGSLFVGAFGRPADIVTAIRSGEAKDF
jgi:simple sugar transport system permease protein